MGCCHSPWGGEDNGCGDLVKWPVPRLACWDHAESFLVALAVPPLVHTVGGQWQVLTSGIASSLSRGLSSPQMSGCVGGGPKFFFRFGQSD